MSGDRLSVQPILDAGLLRAFLAFAETLNFTRAAERIALSQPALFERVRRLSDLVGTPLYDKEGRELYLTPEGVRVAAFASDMLERTGAFVADLSGVRSERVTLAAGEGAYLYLLGPALRAFKRVRDAQLSLVTLGGPDAVAAVRRGRAHLAVGVFDVVPDRLVARDIVQAPLCAAIARGHRLARRRTVRLSDLRSERLILAPPGRRQRDLVARAIGSLGATVEPPIEADGWPQMLAFARAGLGVAVVNGICEPAPGVVFKPIRELGTVTYRLLRRRDAPPSLAVDRLSDLIVGS